MSSDAQSEASRGQSILSTRNLTKRFGGLVAVDDVNLEIPAGEITCIIGPNGAGKSTLLKLIVGHHEPTEGTVLFHGKDITELTPHQRVNQGLSMKFQIPSIYKDISVRQNLRTAFQRYSQNVTADVNDKLSLFNLLQEADVMAGNLPHGKQQWLEIAMALGPNPDLLLLDEPTAGLSVEETNTTADLIRDINETQSVTIVAIEHDMDFVRDIAGDNPVTVMHDGSIFTQDKMDKLEKDEDVQRLYLGEVN